MQESSNSINTLPIFAFAFLLSMLLILIPAREAAAQCAMPTGPDAGPGIIIFNAAHKVMQYCNGDDWVGIWGGGGGSGGSVPAGAVMSFDRTACPDGWSEYLPARGRFVRGIDNGAGVDPDGTRGPGSIQLATRIQRSADPYHGTIGFAHPDANHAETYAGGRHTIGSGTAYSGPNAAISVRPVNVALLYCRKD